MSLLPVEPAYRLAERSQEHHWLVSGLWSEQAVGIVGGEPKCCKSFLALDLAVAVAAGHAARAAELHAELERLQRRRGKLPFLDDVDLRYRNRVMVPEPTARAVMFCLMDVSASMDEA